jgi:predicted molibdopterin-dependent oxidoreductase YjgC
VDHCDAIILWGHNVAETQAVLWMRILDRRRGPDRPRMVAIDPRRTPVAQEAGGSSAARTACSQRCSRASTSRTRPRLPPAA